MCKKQNIHLTLDKDIIRNLERKAKEEERTISQQVNLELRDKYSDWKNGVQNG